MRVELLQQLNASDFQDQSGAWVMKASDVGFIYRLAELAGFQHTCYIKDVIYRYITPADGPRSIRDVSAEKKKQLLKHFASMKPSNPLDGL
jgi:hypothetical protein